MFVLPLFLVIKICVFILFKMYKITWRYVGLNDLYNIAAAIIVSELLLMALLLFILAPYLKIQSFLPSDLSVIGFPRSIFLIDGTISILLLSVLRVSKRIFLDIITKKRIGRSGKNTIIIGAGNTGEMILMDILRQGFSDFYPIGLLDDDPRKMGTYIHGVKVLGSISDLSKFIAKHNIEALLVAIPSLNYKTLRALYNSAKKLNVKTIRIVPRIYDFHKPDINLKKLEDISIEDILGRQAVKIDYNVIERFIKGKVVIITGAGGSIGSEIASQVSAFQPASLILFDIDETELHNLNIKLARNYPYLTGKLHLVVGDVTEEMRIKEVFETFRPHIVFHAAAYKHVPLMEDNSREAVKVNIFGTYTIAKASMDYGVKKFIMISTDKAVRPASVMGATKRMAEHICKAFNNIGNTSFVSVRFGNVLGSRGSVLPLFLDQLKHGGPLTVTDRAMQRYFMTIPEAVSLVLQASIIGEGGEVLVLDMGNPVKIVEFAEELIRIHNLEPYKDIDIQFIGVRPGEKLFEEILTAEEGTLTTNHEKIFIARDNEAYSITEIVTILKEFEAATKNIRTNTNDAVKHLLTQYIEKFKEA